VERLEVGLNDGEEPEVEALIIRTRFETDLNRDAIAGALTQQGFKVSARLVGQVLAAYGLSKKNR